MSKLAFSTLMIVVFMFMLIGYGKSIDCPGTAGLVVDCGVK